MWYKPLGTKLLEFHLILWKRKSARKVDSSWQRERTQIERWTKGKLDLHFKDFLWKSSKLNCVEKIRFQKYKSIYLSDSFPWEKSSGLRFKEERKLLKIDPQKIDLHIKGFLWKSSKINFVEKTNTKVLTHLKYIWKV